MATADTDISKTLTALGKDFIVQTIGSFDGSYFCRRWNSGVQELFQKYQPKSMGDITVNFSVPFITIPYAQMTSTKGQYNDNGWTAMSQMTSITKTTLKIFSNTDQSQQRDFYLIGRWK